MVYLLLKAVFYSIVLRHSKQGGQLIEETSGTVHDPRYHDNTHKKQSYAALKNFDYTDNFFVH
ncbi:hypothetical protein PDPUS_2_01391 [Photobacterium damselae subsp. piscicida]|uniref:Uncharacterized protein n=1 Tax=Photobacterium damsela subsp. piscicida TaxID=38294 RepID=A0AAD1CLK7_PHODP|nr:hypothetical protein PDPUS_2_01391 [Photobacterium damselae subsp. piscicida]